MCKQTKLLQVLQDYKLPSFKSSQVCMSAQTEGRFLVFMWCEMWLSVKSTLGVLFFPIALQKHAHVSYEGTDLNVHVPFHPVTKVRVQKWSFLQSAASLSGPLSSDTNQSFLHEGCDVQFSVKLLNRGADSPVWSYCSIHTSVKVIQLTLVDTSGVENIRSCND